MPWRVASRPNGIPPTRSGRRRCSCTTTTSSFSLPTNSTFETCKDTRVTSGGPPMQSTVVGAARTPGSCSTKPSLTITKLIQTPRTEPWLKKTLKLFEGFPFARPNLQQLTEYPSSCPPSQRRTSWQAWHTSLVRAASEGADQDLTRTWVGSRVRLQRRWSVSCREKDPRWPLTSVGIISFNRDPIRSWISLAIGDDPSLCLTTRTTSRCGRPRATWIWPESRITECLRVLSRKGVVERKWRRMGMLASRRALYKGKTCLQILIKNRARDTYLPRMSQPSF